MEEKNKITLSVIILTKNEESDIAQCLESVQFADEIVVVDSNSHDKTVEIAQKYKTQILLHEFSNFAQQRNFALEKATGEWVLYLDADERITTDLAREIKMVITGSEVDAFRIPRKNVFFHTYQWPGIEMMERLFRKKSLIKWHGDVHESPQINGVVKNLSSRMMHYTHDDLESMVDKTNKWAGLESKLLLDANHPQMKEWRFVRIMLTKFYESYVTHKSWRVGVAGLLEALYQSYSYFIIYARLWELQNNQNQK